MARKKWTAQTEVSDSLVRLREKRKWQVAYRRYVLESTPSEFYAPYFGLDIQTLRRWFELQFTKGTSWETFGKTWQFGHILPATYFDYTVQADLKLCWSFINMYVEMLYPASNSIDILSAKAHFQQLYNTTGLGVCLQMLEKIEKTASASIYIQSAMASFILENKQMLENMAGFSSEEFNQLNQGSSVAAILLEREILRKFG